MQAGKPLYRPHIPLLRVDNVRTGFFEPEQFERVLAHLSPHLRNVATVAYIAGWCARIEILPLEWRQVDLAAASARLDAGTTTEARTPMTAALRGSTLRVHERTARGSDRFAKPGRPRVSLLGIPAGRRTTVGGRPCDTWCARCAEHVAMQLSGHRTCSLFQRYNIVTPGDLQDAARKLDAERQGQ